ncbi:citrate lyase subunit alpha [Veillonella sp. LMAG:2]|uniref:citrate lyase subunit alpha n=1 Tax=Veillonella sp. LMAG:2 TaxID=1969164 RepID=UPI00344BC28D
MTQDPRELMMARNVADIIANTPYFKDGFSFPNRCRWPFIGCKPVFRRTYG